MKIDKTLKNKKTKELIERDKASELRSRTWEVAIVRMHEMLELGMGSVALLEPQVA